MLFKFILMVAVCIKNVQSGCDFKVIDSIKKFWNNNPPTNIIPRYGGTWTITKLSAKDIGIGSDLKCFKEVANANTSTAKDFWYFEDSKDNFDVDIQFVEKPGLIIESYTIDRKDYQDNQYVLYFDGGVLAFWSCTEDMDGETGIAVKDYAKTKDDPKTKEAIQKAEESIKKAGLEVPQGIHTDCPSQEETPIEKKA